MFELPPSVVAPLATILLGAFSIIIRWIAGFQIEGAGSDFALIASSLQLTNLYARMRNVASSENEILALDALLFVFLLCLWGASVKIVRKALETEKRYLRNHLNLYTFVAFALGTISLWLELTWRWVLG